MKEQDKFYTEYIVNKVTLAVLDKDLNYINAQYTDPYSDEMFEQNIVLETKFDASARFDPEFALTLINERKHLIPANILEYYGWGKNGNIKKDILKRLKSIDKNAYMACLEQRLDEINNELIICDDAFELALTELNSSFCPCPSTYYDARDEYGSDEPYYIREDYCECDDAATCLKCIKEHFIDRVKKKYEV